MLQYIILRSFMYLEYKIFFLWFLQNSIIVLYAGKLKQKIY
jgi:hypothetical protein